MQLTMGGAIDDTHPTDEDIDRAIFEGAGQNVPKIEQKVTKQAKLLEQAEKAKKVEEEALLEARLAAQGRNIKAAEQRLRTQGLIGVDETLLDDFYSEVEEG